MATQHKLTPEEQAEQQAVRQFLQSAGQQHIDETRVTRLAMQTRRRIRSESRSTVSPRHRWLSPLFGWRPISLGFAGAMTVAAIMWLQPAPEIPLVEAPSTVLTGNGAEVHLYLEEHAIASDSEALNQGQIVTSMFLHEL